MSDQLNFKQVPFDTMYYNNLSKKGGQVLIECDPNRTVLKIIESCITKNNTVLSDAELAQWILRYHIQRTKNHVENVKICANYLREFFQFGGYFDRFIAKVQQHDYDKLQGNEHVASFALNAPLYKYKDLYEISPEAKRVYEEIEWPKHHQLNDHHPENYMHRPDPEKEQWVISDDELKDAYKDKGGHPAILMALGEMVADWAAVGIEMGDTAKDWWLKNKDKRWSYGPRYTQVLEACLMWIPSKLYVQSSEPIPDPPKLKMSVTSQVGEETTSTETISVSSFRSFESLDIPEDCVESVERGPTVVKPKNDKVFCAFVKDTDIKLPTKGKRVLVNADILHAMGFCCKRATWSDMSGTVTFKISGMVDQIRSHIVIEYRDLRTGSKTRAPDTSRLSFELVVYQINTSKLPGYFLAEGDEDQHLLRYMGDPNDIDLSKIEPLPPYKDVTIAYQYNPKIRGDHKPTTRGTESLTLPASSITLKEMDLSNQVEVKYVTDTADLIDDDPDDYKKWTPNDVKADLKKGRQFFLLMHGSEVVGSIGVMIYKDNTVDLYNLGIFPKYQGKDYGKQGLSATIQYVLTHHPKTTEIYICVYKTNQKAYHLYESMGFKIVETREKTYLMVLKNKPSDEELSMEAQGSSAPSKIAQKKKKILDFICKLCDTMEPSGLNSKRYRQIIGQMNDKEFDQFMNYMKEGKWQLHLVAPNMIVNLQNEDLLKACDMIGLDLFQRVWMYDRATGRKYLTDNKYMFVKLPIRRQQQFLDEKISVPDNDRTIDGLTGQVTGDSRACSITNPEIQILAARGLSKTMQELVNIRGGNIHGYSEFRRMLEENGEADLDTIDPNSRTRASVVGSKLLQSMMLDTNL